MRVLRLDIENFRGIESLTILPRGHVVLTGEPRSGRTTVLEGLRRVLSSDATRYPVADDLDFYGRDTSRVVSVEVVLGSLDATLSDEFWDMLELWDDARLEVVQESPDPTILGQHGAAWVLRLCYRARWNTETELAEHWVDYPKNSDPVAGEFHRVPRRSLALLPFVYAAPADRPLGLAPRSQFRQLVEGFKGEDLGDAFNIFVSALEAAAADFSATAQVGGALESVVDPLSSLLNVEAGTKSELVSFLPEGGSLAGLSRSLGAAVKLDDAPRLPLQRHGSTTTALFRTGEVLASPHLSDAVVAIDDFGDGLDSAASAHLVAALRHLASQSWVATRQPAVASTFQIEEVVRLVRPRPNATRVYQGKNPQSRPDRVASRHLALQLLPAMASTTLALVEGPHDRAALQAAARRRLGLDHTPLLEAWRISVADAGAVDQSGGASQVVKLATFAQSLGFRVVSVLDGDEAGDDALEGALEVSDAVVQLPTGYEIERALVAELDDQVVRDALTQLSTGFGVQLTTDLDSEAGTALAKVACKVIKSSGGLHAQFIELLPDSVLSPVLVSLLDAIVRGGTAAETGHIRV